MSMRPSGGKRRQCAKGVISVRPHPGHAQRALVSFGSLSLNAAIGEGGMSIFKREGDGTTPIAKLTVISGFRARPHRRALRSITPLFPVNARDGWCDAPRHGSYNRRVRLPFAASHETLARADHLYDVVLVLDWNFLHRRRELGSAIFVHVAREDYAPTKGCIALSARDLNRLLPHIRPGTVFNVRRN